MRFSGAILLLMIALAMGQCPLGFTPEEACSAESPSCALFTDGNGDGLCDNPGPQPEEEPAGDEEVETPADTTVSEIPDSSFSEPEASDDSSLTETSLPDTMISVPQQQETEIPEDIQQSDETTEDEETVFVPILPERVVVVSTDQGNQYCLSPRADTVAGYNCILWEMHRSLTDSSMITEGVQIELSDDSVFVDTIKVEEVATPVSSCPLGYSPEEACPEDNPTCILYVDENQDQLCDNPGFITDTTSSVRFEVTGASYSLVTVASGCPLGLPPEAACPTEENSLCPHYMGWNGCTNPSGSGMQRTMIVLVTIAVLLLASTILRNYLCGLGRKQRHKRTIAHITVQIISLLVLGFLVQGCYCPLGALQYVILPVGLIFLGLLGVGVLILPMIWSAFFDRVFCGWVCPFGALQDFLGKIPVPRPPKFSRKIHMLMSGFRYILALLFFGFLMLSSTGQFQSIQPQALFCTVDPFHTIFSFFLVGSFTVAIIFICILIFFPRFFCKYLCFYGAILSFLGRIGLWRRITHKGLPKVCEDKETEDLEFPHKE